MALPDAPSSIETTLNVEKLAALQECQREELGGADTIKARVAVHCAAMLSRAILFGLLAVAKAIERRK